MFRMESQLLFKKYCPGKHWINHPATYSGEFSKFLKKNNFQGLLVDIGCGRGRDVDIFSKNGFNVLGIDNDNNEINIAKSSYDCDFELQDVENLKFQDNSVSAFFMINVIHYTKMEKALREIYRSLKEKGYLFIHFNISIIDENGNIDYEHKEEEILDLVSDFKIIEKKIIERIDDKQIKHTHKIMELILQK